MANIGTSLKNWSSTASSNQPDGTDSATIAGDLRDIQSAVRLAIASQDSIASAATTDLGSKDAGSLTITGTTTITALGTVSAGIRKRVIFAGALTLTHNGTSLILPTAANITTAANDRAEFESLGSGNWRCNWYQRASGAALVGVQDGEVTTAKLAAGVANGLTTVTLNVDADYVVIADASDSGNVKKGLIPAASQTAKGAVELATAAEIKTGTDTARVPAIDQLKSAMGFTAYYESAQQAITAAGQLTLAHGLGRKPILVFAVLVCTSNDLNYTAGQETPVNMSDNVAGGGVAQYGLSIIPDSTNVTIRYGSTASVFAIFNASTGSGAAITPANWRLVIRAWA